MFKSTDRAPQFKSSTWRTNEDVVPLEISRNINLQPRTGPKVLRLTQTMRQMLAANFRKPKAVSF